MHWVGRSITFLLLGVALCAGADGTSHFTSIRGDGCIPMPDDGNFHRTICPGKGGYDVIVMEDNLRENLALQYSGGIMPMLFFAKVSAAPSKMMDIAEWRYSDVNSDIPISLIIALTTDTPGDQEPNGDPWVPPTLSPSGLYNHIIWVVIKLDPTQSCVVDTIDGNSSNAHDNARKVADEAQDWGCV